MSFENQCFHINDERMSWNEADEYCKARQSHLAHITSVDIKNFVLLMLGAQKMEEANWLFVGMKKDEDAFVWKGHIPYENVAVNFSHAPDWHCGQTIDVHEADCVLVNVEDDFSLQNISCTDSHTGIPVCQGNYEFKPGWISHNSSLYYFGVDEISWNEADSYCSQYGGNLVVISSREENEFVSNHFKQLEFEVIWTSIGYHHKNIENVFEWVGTNEWSTYKHPWTPWFDTDDPSNGGDWELVYRLYNGNPGQMCKHPTDIECETVDGQLYTTTGETITCNTKFGLGCTNAKQSDNICSDYKVRFICPDLFPSDGYRQRCTRLSVTDGHWTDVSCTDTQSAFCCEIHYNEDNLLHDEHNEIPTASPTITEDSLNWYNEDITNGPAVIYRIVVSLFESNNYAVIGQTTDSNFNISQWHPELHPRFSVLVGKWIAKYKLVYGNLSQWAFNEASWSPISQCSPGWFSFENQCFHMFTNDTLTWDRASDHCKGQHSHLVHITSVNIKLFVLNMLKNNSIFNQWNGMLLIGMRKKGDNVYFWNGYNYRVPFIYAPGICFYIYFNS
ncbi:uncharacterized protein [Antedon mediterranea]|uniref:uncharacterized protein n=1 Tax=Antedon mediterranea TaxID=105859 RepID=UPI003AF95F8C